MRQRRLMADLEEAKKAHPQLELKSGNVNYWVVPLSGPADSMYAGYRLPLGIEFPENYPFECPTLKFERPIFHPQVYGTSYEVCTGFYKQEWRAASSPAGLATKVLGMLQTPQATDDSEASVLLRQGPEPFRKRLREVMGAPS